MAEVVEVGFDQGELIGREDSGSGANLRPGLPLIRVSRINIELLLRHVFDAVTGVDQVGASEKVRRRLTGTKRP